MGIAWHYIGKRTLAIDALPALLDPSDFADFLQSWRLGKKMDMAAYRYAKTTKKRFTLEEAFFLWKQLQHCGKRECDCFGKQIWKKVDGECLKKILEI